MTTSSRIKQVLSLALVSIMAATAMPTLASATADDYEQNVVTVEVDLGAGPGPGDEELGCQGFASLVLPGQTLPATFNGIVLGAETPTLVDYLAWSRGSGNGNFNNDNLAAYLDTARTGFGFLDPDDWDTYTFETHPADATVNNLEYISYTISKNVVGDDGQVTVENFFIGEDTDQNGRLDGADAPVWVTITRRTYTTESFEISYDADDCIDSQNLAVVLVGRGPVERLPDGVDRETASAEDWVIADSDLVYDYEDNESIPGMADATLMLRTKLIGGLISLPIPVAYSPFNLYPENGFTFGPGLGGSEISPIAFGDEGTAEMKALMRIYGSSPSGVYRTNYYYQLEVEPDYFFDDFLFCGFFGFGDCFP